MSKRKKRIGTSALEELFAIAEEQFESRGGVDLRPSAYDHLARYSKKHPEVFYEEIARALSTAADANDGKARRFFYTGDEGQLVSVMG